MADNGQEIIVASEAQSAPALATSPMELLSRALERGADLSMIEKLMDLSERHDKAQARKAFDAAVADAKAKIPLITKNQKGHTSRYADLGAFAAAVNPVLAGFGLSYRYRSAQEGPAIHVTCVLSHRDGHSEETTLSGGADTTGSKNPIQAMGSTLTYLQRYTLKLALGLADSEGDDDGQAAGGGNNSGPISAEQLKALHAEIDATGADTARLCEALNIDSLPLLPASKLADAGELLAKRARLIAQKKKVQK